MLQLEFISESQFQLEKVRKINRIEKIKETKSRRENLNFDKLSKDDLEYLISLLERPKDHKKRTFHFITLEINGIVLLFNGFNKIVRRFERLNDESNLKFQQRIRSFALGLFLKSENQIGGFKYN